MCNYLNYDNETKLTDLTVGDLKNILNSVLYEIERKRFIEEKQKEIYEIKQKLNTPLGYCRWSSPIKDDKSF